MGDGKQGVMVVEMSKGLAGQNPITQLQAKYKELEGGFREWLAKQSLAVEATVVTATSAAQGAAIGAFMGTLTNDVSSSLPTPPPQAALNPQAMASFQQAQALAGGPLVQARNFAVMTGVNAGITCVMKRIRGKEDVHMVAAFGSGAMFSLVSGMGGPNQAANVVSSGLFFALIQGGLFQVGQLDSNFKSIFNVAMQLGKKFSQPPVEDVLYSKTRFMLSSLGLQNYEKNFKKGLLTDSTLPLLTDRQVLCCTLMSFCLVYYLISALRDVRIPPGPRLLILDRIQRFDLAPP
ncbi:hypothetical protein RJ639_001086 [Escallonia herrerae]|uniref:Mitochondrial import inner membrane translocase subunit TIM22 n=1 Tax=Escallonia herrerae TaxID=1293975 RepID=A0AA88XAC8_9ASTE|nr:hypothetical protein RJ639_001086 [Escallonia herrerae]